MSLSINRQHYDHPLPSRVRLLILGGGIHGVGVLHDMATRGWKDVHLIEKDVIGWGTSCRSTKLIHGGLRYLRNLRDYGLVMEALRERQILLKLAPDLVKPIELLFPILQKGGLPGIAVNAGLTLYDLLAGRYKIAKHTRLSPAQALTKAPHLDIEKISKIYSFWDAQTDDWAFLSRVAASAAQLGGRITESCRATRIWPSDDGWIVEVRRRDGSLQRISALYVLNGLGPWANSFLEASGMTPTHRAFNNKGVHLLFKDLGFKAGLFLQSPEDQRIFFILPWLGNTLVGTTEDLYTGDPDDLMVKDEEIKYLLERCNRYLSMPLQEKNIEATFAGLRWLPIERGHDITATSRAYIVGEKTGGRGLLLTIYGGKYTTYRTLAKAIGDRLTSHFGEYRPSMTHDPRNWVTENAATTPPLPLLRFAVGPEQHPSPAGMSRG